MNFPKHGTHISVSRSCTHPKFPENYEGCIRTDTMMIGYLFVPFPEINGTKMHWIYIDNLKGSIPGDLVQSVANLMHIKTYMDMKSVMNMYNKNTLNLNN